MQWQQRPGHCELGLSIHREDQQNNMWQRHFPHFGHICTYQSRLAELESAGGDSEGGVCPTSLYPLLPCCVPAPQYLQSRGLFAGSQSCVMSRQTSCWPNSTGWHQRILSRSVLLVFVALEGLLRLHFRGLALLVIHRCDCITSCQGLKGVSSGSIATARHTWSCWHIQAQH